MLKRHAFRKPKKTTLSSQAYMRCSAATNLQRNCATVAQAERMQWRCLHGSATVEVNTLTEELHGIA